MRLNIITDESVIQDVISGKVCSSSSFCFSRKRLLGYISLEIIMVIDSHSGLFSKSKIVLYEEEKEFEFNPEIGNPFTFDLREIEKKLNYQLPDSYTGDNLRIVYRLVARFYPLLCIHEAVRYVEVKAKTEIQTIPCDVILNKNDINDFDGLLCASNIDFVPEVHISCHLNSTAIRMGDGIQGFLKVDQCNMGIQNISIGVVQNEKIQKGSSVSEYHVLRNTIEIATGDCLRNQDIPFLFFPDIAGIARNFESETARLSFSLCINVLFCNQFYCVKYVPIEFSW